MVGIQVPKCCGYGMFIPDPEPWFLSIPDPETNESNKRGAKKISCLYFFVATTLQNWKLFDFRTGTEKNFSQLTKSFVRFTQKIV
jgi:hypothetical protein